MSQPVVRPSAWSVHRAFVVQFRIETNAEDGRVAGRIEHVASQETSRFQSWREMQTFMENVLKQVQTNHPGTP